MNLLISRKYETNSYLLLQHKANYTFTLTVTFVFHILLYVPWKTIRTKFQPQPIGWEHSSS